MAEKITGIQERIMLALALEAKGEPGERIEAARILEGVAADIRFEVRRDRMSGTVALYQGDGLQRYCGNCGVGVVIMSPVDDRRASRRVNFRIDRRYCSNKCRQAAYRKRHPKAPAPPKVIYL